jgi:hypothetical protein
MSTSSRSLITSKRHVHKSHRRSRRQVPTIRYPSEWILDLAAKFPTPGQYDDEVFNLLDSVENLAFATTGTVTNTFANIFIALSNLPDASSYAAVFDQYRIVSAKIQMTPSVPPLSGVLTGHVHTVIDYDDTASITPAQALNYNNCIVSNLQDTLVRSFKPRMAMSAYSGAFTSFTNMEPQWIDCASPSVQHYGIKIAINPTGTAINFDIISSIHVQFRNSR